MAKNKIVCTCGGWENSKEHTDSCPIRYVTMSPWEIARVIKADWKKPYFGAVPYIEALAAINEWGDAYLCETSNDIAIGFLSNAATWRGPVAKAAKIVLDGIVVAW